MPAYWRARTPSPSAFSIRPLEKSVTFSPQVVSSVSRRLTNEELWKLFDFESHARQCVDCLDPYHVHRAQGALCPLGHSLAREVARTISSKRGAREIFDASPSAKNKLVRVHVPDEYQEVRGLLLAMERSLRHPRQRPIVTMIDVDSKPFDATASPKRSPSSSTRRRSPSTSRATKASSDSPRHHERRASGQTPKYAYATEAVPRPAPSSWYPELSKTLGSHPHPFVTPAAPAPAPAAPLLRTKYVPKPTITPDTSGSSSTSTPDHLQWPVQAKDTPTDKRASMHDGWLSTGPAYTTELREPRSRRYSGIW